MVVVKTAVFFVSSSLVTVVLMRSKILEPQQEYTFSYFYSLNNLLEDIVAEFGYTTALESLVLPRGSFDELRAEALREQPTTCRYPRFPPPR